MGQWVRQSVRSLGDLSRIRPQHARMRSRCATRSRTISLRLGSALEVGGAEIMSTVQLMTTTQTRAAWTWLLANLPPRAPTGPHLSYDDLAKWQDALGR